MKFFINDKSYISWSLGSFIEFFRILKNRGEKKKKLIQHFEKNRLEWLKENDLSSHFTKNTKKSIVKRPFNETVLCFDFNKTGLKPINKLLLLDDAIDRGTTITIFLNHLIKYNLINEKTEIKAICIYNVFKRQDKQNEREIKEYEKNSSGFR